MLGGIDMDSLIKNIFLAGVGSLAITYDRSKEILDEFVEKGQLTIEQGRELNEELKKVIDEKKPTKQDIAKDLNLATKEDIEIILDRLTKLENKNTEKK